MCDYCDFAKLYVNNDLVDRYMEALMTELSLKIDMNDRFKTIYIGGGTPSILEKKHVDLLFSFIQRYIQDDAEITFEMNPEDVTPEYIAMLATFGVNRISLGVQSFSDDLIQRVGRNHTASKSMEAIQILKASTITNITVDLMFALPGQTLASVYEDLACLKQFDLPHISLYSLILEKRTKLYLQQERYQFVDEDLEAQMYTDIIDYLNRIGYTQYEMSNFSQSDKFESKHNLAYWHQNHYYGVGLGAHQFINHIRSANTKSINTYINKLKEKVIPVSEHEILTEKQLFEEFCFLSFRDCVRGLSLVKLQQKYPIMYRQLSAKVSAILEELGHEDLIEMYEVDSYRLTLKGRMLANEVFQAFINIE